MRHTALGHEVENSEPITRNLDICAVSATLPSQFLSNVNGNTFQRTLTWSKLYGYLGNLSSIIQRLDRAARSPALRDEGILLTTARAPGRAEDDIKDYVHAQSCRRIFLNGFFGNDYNDIENCCDNCDPDTQESSPPLETTLDMKMVDVEPSKQSTDIEPGEQYLKKRDTIMSDDRIKKLASKSVGIMTPESIFVATGWLFPRTEYALALCKIIVDLNADTVLKRQATSGRLSPEEQNSQALQRQMTYLRQTRHFNYITSKDVQPLQHFLKSQVDYKALPQRSEPHRRLVQVCRDMVVARVGRDLIAVEQGELRCWQEHHFFNSSEEGEVLWTELLRKYWRMSWCGYCWYIRHCNSYYRGHHHSSSLAGGKNQ
ncbi:hypothetical protein BCR41DRAFT_395060 [Lobosporangium transversale]|uniref:Uncharacterized protein n=1 Tax=Lobosporangium transversale TaxID=64571 RepID=A0A1Y2GR81_9FUNG|nr:hypothetical protein BCR41DRAFT_395060 [Lobosporangium transversale]ORZ20045.1 hypothetical protein BCR41DRAFT_395060 [Lobosporangium transversale]|eukprot:XP_021882585.1 hypothetical protein BCR41DRAFT_395060 [Lobosporangium transversale]